MDKVQAALLLIITGIHWLPNNVIGLLMCLLATAVALALHRLVRRVVRHFLAERYPYVFSAFARMRGVTAFALLTLALIVALPVAPFDHSLTFWLQRLLLIAVITLIGWCAIAGVDLAADLYLRRFRLDVEDNLLARKHVTQVRVLLRSAYVLIVVVTVAAALMTFQPVRQYGVSLFASAGVAGLIAGLAARPVLSNIFAGVQLAMTQPIRIDDAVIVENEWGIIEEINSAYVVVRLWDWRRMIVPLSYFIEKPFQNWTRHNSALIGSALFYVDYTAPVAIIRSKLEDIVKGSKKWSGQVVNLQVTDIKERTVELRALMSANSAGDAFDLRCEVREKLIDFLQREYPGALPRERGEETFELKDRREMPRHKAASRRRLAKMGA